MKNVTVKAIQPVSKGDGSGEFHEPGDTFDVPEVEAKRLEARVAIQRVGPGRGETSGAAGGTVPPKQPKQPVNEADRPASGNSNQDKAES